MTVTRPASKAIRFAITGAIAAVLLAGTASGGSAAPSTARSVSQAQTALAKGKVERAIAIAEGALAHNPRDAGLRAVLAQSYLRAGRFESAATTFEDAMQLGDNSARTTLGLALAHAASGRNEDAVAILDEWRDAIPAEDLGLAFALAGETGRGVAILSDALRAGNASAKLRQNLAYAYALDGRWREARVMIAQDIPADKVDARISEWAMQAKPEDQQKRVASLLGAPVREDSGQPQRLALADSPSPAQMASESTQSQPAAEPAVPDQAEQPATADTLPSDSGLAANAQSAQVQPVQDVPAAAASQQFATAFAQPESVSQPVVQPLPSRPEAAPSPAATATTATKARASGTHVVQLGSFASPQSAQRAKGIFAARNPQLRGYNITITPAVVRGMNYWRVSAVGFDAGSARSMCSSVKASGGACFAYAASTGVPGTDHRAGGAQRARRR